MSAPDPEINSMSETTIIATGQVITLVNVFTVEPSQQDRLVEAWQRSTDEVIRHLPGFVSANIHRGLDGTTVVNYAQWESVQAFNGMLADPEAREWLRQLSRIGTPAPVLCEVVSVHHAID